MSKYYHGVRVIEEGEAAARTITGTAGMQVIVGTAPGKPYRQPGSGSKCADPVQQHGGSGKEAGL